MEQRARRRRARAYKPTDDSSLDRWARAYALKAIQPDIRYSAGDPQIAYEFLGDGDLDLVFAFDWASDVELIWQQPSVERFLGRLASFSRLVVFDTRGMGLSNPVVAPPPPEEWTDDVRAAMDAVGSERTAIVGHGHGGQLGAIFAASHEERTQTFIARVP